jgi:hypothetical protein
MIKETMDTKEKIETLVNYYSQKDVLMLDKQSLIDSILTPEIKEKLEDINAEFSEKTDAVDANIKVLESEIGTEVIAQKATVKTDYMQVIYNKGREGGWDTSKLEGFALAHPEINVAKKPDGKPYVTFRKI